MTAIGDVKFQETLNGASFTMTPASGEIWKIIWFTARSINNNVDLTPYLRVSSTDYELWSVNGTSSQQSVCMYGNHLADHGGAAATNNMQTTDYRTALFQDGSDKWVNIRGPGIFIDDSVTFKLTASSGNIDCVAQAIVVKV